MSVLIIGIYSNRCGDRRKDWVARVIARMPWRGRTQEGGWIIGRV